jgi:hypothetical protein
VYHPSNPVCVIIITIDNDIDIDIDIDDDDYDDDDNNNNNNNNIFLVGLSEIKSKRTKVQSRARGKFIVNSIELPL